MNTHPLPTSRQVTRKWVREQISSALFIPLSLYVLATFFLKVIMGNGRESVTDWLRSPSNGLIMVLFIAVTAYYKASWFDTIIDDYVHDRKLHRVGKLIVKTSAWLFAIAGIAAVLKIIFGS